MKEGKILIDNLKTIYIVITTIYCIIHASWWSKNTFANLCIKISFILLSIFGIILILSDLNILNINITWMIK